MRACTAASARTWHGSSCAPPSTSSTAGSAATGSQRATNPTTTTPACAPPSTCPSASKAGKSCCPWLGQLLREPSGLPSGLTISTSGQISGTPTARGTFTVTATATDSLGAAGSTSFSWVIKRH
ncbi:MAG: putative Ig domain-containing protein [Acidobacteria bacterium]|nr:putative Ig domain-containing protein [Acidobacteriota bacterium]